MSSSTNSTLAMESASHCLIPPDDSGSGTLERTGATLFTQIYSGITCLNGAIGNNPLTCNNAPGLTVTLKASTLRAWRRDPDTPASEGTGQGTPTCAGRPRPIFRMLALLAAVSASFPATPSSLPDLGEASGAVLSAQAERKLGEETLRGLRASGAYLNDPEVNAYLEQLGHRLVSAVPGLDGDFHFFAVNAPDINAFALPGGYIGVHAGLVLATESESELASVLAHEISHVTQHHIARQAAAQSGDQLIMLAAMAAAILAARSGDGQMSSAAMTTAMAAQTQKQMNYTREYEHEADRLGFQLLDQAGFDPQAMAGFFQKLQKATTLLDNQSYSWLRTHPMTHQRIAEAQDRAFEKPYRQVASGPDFHYVRALLRSYDGTPEEAVRRLEASPREGRGPEPAAHRYGLAAALLRAKDYSRAQAEIDRLGEEGVHHPMIEALAGQVLQHSGHIRAALARYEAALRIYPGHLQLVYDYTQALILDKRYGAAASFAEDRLIAGRDDATLHRLVAEARAGLGQNTLSHYHQGEHYAALGDGASARAQYELAVRANDGGFHDLAMVEARLREMRSGRGGATPTAAKGKDREKSRRSLLFP